MNKELLFSYPESQIEVSSGTLKVDDATIIISDIKSTKLKVIWHTYNLKETKQIILNTADKTYVVEIHMPAIVTGNFLKKPNGLEKSILNLLYSNNFDSSVVIEHHYSKFRQLFFRIAILFSISACCLLVALVIYDPSSISAVAVTTGITGCGIALGKSFPELRKNRLPFETKKENYQKDIEEFIYTH